MWTLLWEVRQRQGEPPGFGRKMEMDSNHCLATRILKSIPSLVDTSFFFFLLLFLLSAEGGDKFPSLGSGGNEILVLSWVRVRLVHTHPGETTCAFVARLGSLHRARVTVSSLCWQGIAGPFPASLLSSGSWGRSSPGCCKQAWMQACDGSHAAFELCS